MGPFKQLALLAIFATAVYAEEPSAKAKKAIGIFNIVKFDNDVCDAGNNMSGTCFTAEECSDRNGVASGSCAEGYGVCCVITLTCGATTRANCTYLNQQMSNTPATDSDSSQSCTYNICPVTDGVRRIRLEMETFVIEPPFTPVLDGAAGGTVAGADATDVWGQEGSIGHCEGDSFVASSGVGSSPMICGTNSGQHMVLDTDGSMCVTAIFNFRSGGAQQRSYRIHVLQFGEFNDMGGPMGCLQYYTEQMGTVNTFNWVGPVGATSVHLANQHYNVCIRRLVDACRICWSPIQTAATRGDQAAAARARGAFGISNSAGTAAGTAMGGMSASCAESATTSEDFVVILGGNDAGAGAVGAGANMGAGLIDGNIAAGEQGGDVFCGRFFTQVAAGPMSMQDRSICSRVTPFRLGVHFDDHEAVGLAAGDSVVAMAKDNEASAATAAAGAPTTPLGIQGFSLGFAQLGC